MYLLFITSTSSTKTAVTITLHSRTPMMNPSPSTLIIHQRCTAAESVRREIWKSVNHPLLVPSTRLYQPLYIPTALDLSQLTGHINQ